jgi:hypothetical protein
MNPTHQGAPTVTKLTDSTAVDMLVLEHHSWRQFAILSFSEAKATCERATGAVVAVFEGTVVAASDTATAYRMPTAR